MTTFPNLTNEQLTGALRHLFPDGEWATEGNAVISVPDGETMPTEAEMLTAFQAFETAQATADADAEQVKGDGAYLMNLFKTQGTTLEKRRLWPTKMAILDALKNGERDVAIAIAQNPVGLPSPTQNELNFLQLVVTQLSQ